MSVLLLTLAAGQGRGEGRLGVLRVYSMRVTVIVCIKKSGLGCRHQRHGPLHIVIVGPDGTNLVERQHRVQLRPQGMSRVHPGEPAGGHQGWKPRPGKGDPTAHGTSDKPANTQRKRLQSTLTCL